MLWRNIHKFVHFVCNWIRGLSRILFTRGRLKFLEGRDIIFSERGGANKFLLLLKLLCPWGIIDQWGAENLIILKPVTCFCAFHLCLIHESFFHQGRKHTIFNFISGIFSHLFQVWFIRGICPLCPCAGHTSELNSTWILPNQINIFVS